MTLSALFRCIMCVCVCVCDSQVMCPGSLSQLAVLLSSVFSTCLALAKWQVLPERLHSIPTLLTPVVHRVPAHLG